MSKDRPLSMDVEQDELVIRIGLDTLTFAAENSEVFRKYDQDIRDWKLAFRVSNKAEFAKGVLHKLQEEAEDGSTPLTRLLDEGFLDAIESAAGVEEVET